MSTITKKKPSRKSAAQKKTSKPKYAKGIAFNIVFPIFHECEIKVRCGVEQRDTGYPEIQKVFLELPTLIQKTFSWYANFPRTYEQLNPVAFALVDAATKKALALAEQDVIDQYKDACPRCKGPANICGPRHAQGKSCGLYVPGIKIQVLRVQPCMDFLMASVAEQTTLLQLCNNLKRPCDSI